MKSKTPGLLNGVSRISSRCVTACSRKLKSKTPKADPACTTPEKQEPQFVHITLKVSKLEKGSWMPKVDKLMKECGDCMLT
ncbi:hypothetical protein Tco_0104964 [Tanacetum coccineum]